MDDSTPRSRRAITVTWFELDVSESTFEGLQQSLDHDERARVSRLASATLQLRATVGFARRRQVLAGLLGTAPRDVLMTSTFNGRPVVSGPGTIVPDFSVSSCAEIGVIATSFHYRVGIDVESLIEPNHLNATLRWAASPREQSRIEELPTIERAFALTRLWTRKEAYLKATGAGIGSGMRHLDVPGEATTLNRVLQLATGDEPAQLVDIACPRPGFVASLAVLGESEVALAEVVEVSSLET